jgi:hypothetical protein
MEQSKQNEMKMLHIQITNITNMYTITLLNSTVQGAESSAPSPRVWNFFLEVRAVIWI